MWRIKTTGNKLPVALAVRACADDPLFKAVVVPVADPLNGDPMVAQPAYLLHLRHAITLMLGLQSDGVIPNAVRPNQIHRRSFISLRCLHA